MAKIFSLFGEIFIENEQAKTAITDTTKKAEESESGFGKMIGTAGKIGAAVVTGAAAAVGGLTAMVSKVTETTGLIADNAAKAGMSAEEYQKWKFAAEQSGMTMETLQGAMVKQQKAFADAKFGATEAVVDAQKLAEAQAALSLADNAYEKQVIKLDEARKKYGENSSQVAKAILDVMDAETKVGLAHDKLNAAQQPVKGPEPAVAIAYEKLGISLNSVKDSEEAFNLVIGKLAGMTDETERNAISMDIFGKSYAELAPMLNSGADGINALKQQAVDLGAVMSNDAVAQGEALGDTLDQLKAAATGVFNSLGTSLVPIVQTFADLLLKNIPMIQGMVSGIGPALGKFLADALPMIMQLAQQLLPVIFQLIQQLLPIIMALMPFFIQLVMAILPPVLQLLQLLLPPLIQLLNLIIPPLTAVIRILANVFGVVLGSAINALMPIITGLMKMLTGVIDFVAGVFTGNWSKAWDGISNIFKGVFDALSGYIKAPLNFIIDMINRVFSSIGSIEIPDWVPVIGGNSFSLPQIPRLKVGMDYVPNDFYPAFLDKGERVLTASENREYSSGGRTINVIVDLDGYTMMKAMGQPLVDTIRLKTGLAY